MPVRLVWAMNVAPPYRLPVWGELAQRLDLQVWLLAVNEHNRRWAVPQDRNFTVRVLRTIGVRRGEAVHYVLKQPLGRPMHSPDVLILPGWDSPAAWQILCWAKRRGVRTLAFNESTLGSRRHTAGPVALARRSFFRHVDGVLTVSPGSTAAVLDAGVPRHRITEIVNAVDLEMIPEPPSPPDPRSPGAPHVFLFCGQLIARKSPSLVIQALALMADDSRLVVAGNGPKMDELIDLARRNNVQDRVDFLGYVDPEKLAGVYRRCHTLVLPSEQEVHGLVVMEALMAGLHAIVSDRAGVADVVRDMTGAWVSKPEEQSLTECMIASKLAWQGPVQDPEARAHSPRTMAAQIQHTVNALAIGHRSATHPAG